jgi:hypothetical protein
VIYRCTARFLQSFDVLDSRIQALALKAMAGFKETPRAPTPHAHLVCTPDPSMNNVDVWDVPFGNGYHLTYSVVAGDHPDHFVCVLRNVGRE